MAEETVTEAVDLAHSQAGKLLAPQLQLAQSAGKRKHKFFTAGADPAAAERVFDKGRGAVQSALQSFSLSGNDGQAILAEEKMKLQEKLKATGFSRIDVRPLLFHSTSFATRLSCTGMGTYIGTDRHTSEDSQDMFLCRHCGFQALAACPPWISTMHGTAWSRRQSGTWCSATTCAQMAGAS